MIVNTNEFNERYVPMAIRLNTVVYLNFTVPKDQKIDAGMCHLSQSNQTPHPSNIST